MNDRYSNDLIGIILNNFAMANKFVRESVDDVPKSRMTEQPGTIVNHPAWTLSHLNAYAGVLLTMLDDPSAPNADAEHDEFGYGTIPVPNASAYPTKRELLARFDDRNARLSAVIATKHAEYFPKPAPEKFQPYSPTIGHVAIILITTHVSYHLGQLKQWRRAAGITQKQ